ncbi:MAG: CRISPR-associated endoribonuclease Cas6 [Bacteroidetes bacterium]|jgi:CRISPR-associated endoribonuclease Cas6|nr:CRISPR-associated endoribonuclease Cas6 [Bacteroidota bacterium]
MRVKISFLRDQMSANTIPLHHQTLIAESLYQQIESFGGDRNLFNFSSLKGTSKIQNGFMRFLSSKVTLVLSARDGQQLEQLVSKIFEMPYLAVGKMNLMPRSHEMIADPEFNTKMRYLCISPMILVDPAKDPEKSQITIDPTSQEFSDILYEQTLDRMERAGFSESDLNNFAEFDAQPDHEYVQKLNETGKKFARYYRAADGSTMMGYLLPFTLHAHPDVQKFIWESGVGALSEQGYGMVDLVKIAAN